MSQFLLIAFALIIGFVAGYLICLLTAKQ